MQRRTFIKSLGAVTPLLALSSPLVLSAKEDKPVGKNAMDYQTAIDTITGKKGAKDSDKIKLTVPEIAENGAVVPVKIEIDAPMTEKDYVKSIHVLSSKNSNVRSVDVFLTPANAKAYFSTRVKLGKSQDVVVIAQLGSGEFIKTQKPVKVTIGGCG